MREKFRRPLRTLDDSKVSRRDQVRIDKLRIPETKKRKASGAALSRLLGYTT